MGQEIYLYRNPENTLYGWMQKHYPAMRTWALTQKATQSEHYACAKASTLTESTYQLLSKIGSDLPLLEKVHEALNAEELKQVLELIFYAYDDFLACHHLPRLLDGDGFNSLPNSRLVITYQINFTSFLEARPHCPHAVYAGRLICRNYTQAENSPCSEIGYWTAEECQALIPLLQAMSQAEHPEYGTLETEMRVFFENDEYTVGDIDEILDSMRILSSRLLGDIQLLHPGEGFLSYFSY